MTENTKDLIGKVVGVSEKRSFESKPEWLDEPQKQSIINVFIETKELKYGIWLPREEHVVLFGKEADQFDEEFQKISKQAAKKKQSLDINILFENCKKKTDPKTKKPYKSYAAKLFHIISEQAAKIALNNQAVTN